MRHPETDTKVGTPDFDIFIPKTTGPIKVLYRVRPRRWSGVVKSVQERQCFTYIHVTYDRFFLYPFSVRYRDLLVLFKRLRKIHGTRVYDVHEHHLLSKVMRTFD